MAFRNLGNTASKQPESLCPFPGINFLSVSTVDVPFDDKQGYKRNKENIPHLKRTLTIELDQVNIFFTYIVRYPHVDQYWLLVG